MTVSVSRRSEPEHIDSQEGQMLGILLQFTLTYIRRRFRMSADVDYVVL